MTREEAAAVLLDVLREAQDLSGHAWTDIGMEAKPIGALEGFDSLNGVEATVMIEQRLGCTLDVESIFVSEDGRKALTVREIAERLRKRMASREART